MNQLVSDIQSRHSCFRIHFASNATQEKLVPQLPSLISPLHLPYFVPCSVLRVLAHARLMPLLGQLMLALEIETLTKKILHAQTKERLVLGR